MMSSYESGESEFKKQIICADNLIAQSRWCFDLSEITIKHLKELLLFAQSGNGTTSTTYFWRGNASSVPISYELPKVYTKEIKNIVNSSRMASLKKSSCVYAKGGLGFLFESESKGKNWQTFFKDCSEGGEASFTLCCLKINNTAWKITQSSPKNKTLEEMEKDST